MPHFDCKRKLNTYRAMDRIEAATPIMAYPILGSEGGTAATRRYEEAQRDLLLVTGMKTGDKTMPVPDPKADAELREILELEIGDKIFDIEELLRDTNG